MKTFEVVKALAALAQESRLAIFRLLVEKGPAGVSAGKIAERLNILPTTLSFHLKELHNAGLVESNQKGRFQIYIARFDRMNSLLTFLTANCCGGDACTGAMLCTGIGRGKPTASG